MARMEGMEEGRREKGRIVLVVGWATSELMRVSVDRCHLHRRYHTTPVAKADMFEDGARRLRCFICDTFKYLRVICVHFVVTC